MTRLIPALKRISYEERMNQMGITSLEVRRRRGDLIQIFKIFNEFEKVNLIESPKFLHSNRLQEHSMRYTREITTHDFRHNFLLNRSANFWNNLPKKAIESENTDKFKAEIDLAINDWCN